MPRRPLEVINLAVLAALAALVVAYRGRLPFWPTILARYALMAAFVFIIALLARQEDRLARTLRVVVNFYPAAFVPLVYESLGPLIPAVRPGRYDALLIAADRALFGVDPTVWLERILWPPLTDLLFLAYSTYYFLPIVLGAGLWMRHPPEAKRFIFVISFCFYVSYIGYFCLPAIGPRFSLADRQTAVLEQTPISRAIARTLNELEHTKEDAFPSGHTLIAVSVLLVARKRLPRLFGVFLPIVGLLVFSTVYCRFHYVVDVAAGVTLALICVPLGEKVYDWAAASERVPADPGLRVLP
jgi:membrane-associated phospholipid phosphatase